MQVSQRRGSTVMIRDFNLICHHCTEKFINNPNIVNIFEFYEDEKNFYIVTEICHGGKLSNHIKDLYSKG